MSHLIDQLQVKVKKTTSSFFVFFFRLLSGFMLGLTLAIVGQVIFGYQQMMYVFFIVLIMGIFMTLSRNWGMFSIILFDMLFFLSAVLCKMYILVAPGS